MLWAGLQWHKGEPGISTALRTCPRLSLASGYDKILLSLYKQLFFLFKIELFFLEGHVNSTIHTFYSGLKMASAKA